ncbi:MAG: HPr family phosphocarrier protein [Mariprofundaceae bacterium]|nr:HPr family phosphocarrier protein [Mariprofundaceae bacterium]
MAEQEIAIQNRLGLHARASALFVKTAASFRSEVFVRRDDMEVNGKSIMGVLLLAASQGTVLLLRTEGIDADRALIALIALVDDCFGEGG